MAEGSSKGPNYLPATVIELSPRRRRGLGPGRVRDDDPFEKLTCGDADPIMVADLMTDSGRTSARCSRLKWTTPPARAGSRPSCSTRQPGGHVESHGRKVQRDRQALQDPLVRRRPGREDPNKIGALSVQGVAVRPPARCTTSTTTTKAGMTPTSRRSGSALTDSNDGDPTAGDLGKADLLSSRMTTPLTTRRP